MVLIKFTCPKCSYVYTMNSAISEQVCPICGAPFFEEHIDDLPNLDVPNNLSSSEDTFEYAFKLLYFRSYERIKDFVPFLEEHYPSSYWTYMFSLIGETGIDFIFLLPKVEYELSEDEIKEDARTRFYHYARRKYSKAPQSTFNKIAGFYPDVPSNNRRKWNKARTKYEEKMEMVEGYYQISNLIRNKYLDKFEELAVTNDQKIINHNLKIWMNKVSHAQVDLKRYNQSIDSIVREDYERTPNPGNRPLFTGYMILYLLSFLTTVISVSHVVLSLINRSFISGTMSYVSAAIASALIIASTILLLSNLGWLRDRPVISVISLIAVVFICGSGITTAGLDVLINWYFIFSFVVSIALLFYISFKIVKYMPHNTQSVGTIIGDYEKLKNDSFEVNFVFVFKIYQGDDPEELVFSRGWLKE